MTDVREYYRRKRTLATGNADNVLRVHCAPGTLTAQWLPGGTLNEQSKCYISFYAASCCVLVQRVRQIVLQWVWMAGDVFTKFRFQNLHRSQCFVAWGGGVNCGEVTADAGFVHKQHIGYWINAADVRRQSCCFRWTICNVTRARIVKLKQCFYIGYEKRLISIESNGKCTSGQRLQRVQGFSNS